MASVDRHPTRRRRGWLVAAILAIIVALILAGLGISIVTLDPLRSGSMSGSDPVGLLATTEDDAGILHRYRYEPSTSFMTLASVRNTGPIAITFVGLVEPRADIADSALMWPEALLLLPDDAGMVGAEGSLPFAPVAIEAGHERAVWIRWRVGSSCVPGQLPPYPPESGLGLGPLLPFRWSVFGIARTSEVDLGYAVEAFNPPEDPLTVCPG